MTTVKVEHTPDGFGIKSVEYKTLIPSEIQYFDQKQTIWVALWASQMDSEFVGVFSSREFAEEAAALYQEEQKYGDGYVEQWEVDGKQIEDPPKYFKNGKWQ